MSIRFSILALPFVVFLPPIKSVAHDLSPSGVSIGAPPLAEISAAPNDALQGLVDTAKIWEIDLPVTLCFLDGSAAAKRFFVDRVREWTDNAPGLDIGFGQAPDYNVCSVVNGDIRVSFNSAGDWSYVGRDATRVKAGEPTLNLSTLRSGLTERTRALATGNALHEIGHALGAEHEHQRSEFAACLSRLDLEQIKRSTQWDDDKIEDNITDILKGRGETTYDPASVMNYHFPANWFQPGTDASCLRPRRTVLSDGDRAIVAGLYPATQVLRDEFLNGLVRRATQAAQGLEGQERQSFEQAFDAALPQEFKQQNGGISVASSTVGVIVDGSVAATASGSSVAIGTVGGSVTIGEQRPPQPEQVEIVATPIVTYSRQARKTIKHPRVGASTGDLINKECKSYTYGATPGWQIDTGTPTFVDLVTKAWSSRRFTARTAQSVTAEFCAKAQIHKITEKRTGDSYGSVQYVETRMDSGTEPGAPVTIILRPPNTSSTIAFPSNAVGLTALVNEPGKSPVQASGGQTGNYRITLDQTSKLLTVQWAPQ